LGAKKQAIPVGTYLWIMHVGKYLTSVSTLQMPTRQSAVNDGLNWRQSKDGIDIKKYHADNGIFPSKAFKEECDLKGQGYSFSGVGAHHQNGVAKQNIKIIANWAQENMLHMAHH
jgi:hypothetical protein